MHVRRLLGDYHLRTVSDKTINLVTLCQKVVLKQTITGATRYNNDLLFKCYLTASTQSGRPHCQE